MQLLGIADVYNREGYLLVKPHVSQVLKYVGVVALDKNGRKVGKVVDVIGRTDDPRFVVKLDYREIGEILVRRKEEVYFTHPRRTRRPRKQR